MAYDEELAERVRRVLEGRSKGVIVERKMMGALAFMIDGAMCCSVSDQGLLIRVEAGQRDALLKNPEVSPMQLGARTMKGFCRVAPEAVLTDDGLASWLDRGLAARAANTGRRPR